MPPTPVAPDHQQSHPARRRQNGLLGNIQLSAQRNTRICTRFYSRQLRNDVLLQAQYLPDETNIPDATDTIQVNRNLHFEQITDVCGIGMDEIKSLNPQYKKNIIPGDSKPDTPPAYKLHQHFHRQPRHDLRPPQCGTV